MTGGYLYHRRMAEAAPSHDAKVSFVSFPARRYLSAARRAGEVMAEAQRSGTDLVAVDSIAASLLAPWLRTRRPDLPLVAILHQPPGGIDHGPVQTRVQGALDRSVYRRARCLLAASRALADELEAIGFPAARIRVVAPGRDAAAAPDGPPRELRWGRHAAFLCVGNWVARKGILSVLDAFARLSPEAGTLHLVGDQKVDPSYGALVKARLSEADLAGRVALHGTVTKERVAALYAAADVFVLPSWKEPYGTVYGEAMSAGLPVVGWHAGNLVNLADNEREGVLVRPGDVEGLSRAMERLALDEAYRLRLASAAHRRAESLPTWEDTARLFFSCLSEVLDEEGAAR